MEGVDLGVGLDCGRIVSGFIIGLVGCGGVVIVIWFGEIIVLFGFGGFSWGGWIFDVGWVVELLRLELFGYK